ncbi:uncharacterized protein LOC114349621 isoform X1 [Ostrinia furnacalis]|uniref:uncharacterized protein LOC114349621 isoform X1 n=1 Tax=Ostrinia furnacalis TaxID=93504 RepID=UPI00103903B3|nr:uncharacterized protein LOC114349621 isoform X1 [Ostrinia furnacalis]
MDLKGSLVDTSLKIYPSIQFLDFIKGQSFNQNVPLNIGKIVNGESYKEKTKDNETFKPVDVNLTNKEIEILNQFTKTVEDENENSKVEPPPSAGKKGNEIGNSAQSLEVKTKVEEKDSEEKLEGPFLSTSDIEWLYVYLKEKRTKDPDTPHLHKLLEGSQIALPENQVLKRNPDLEARCVKLRAQQEAREYRKMTKGVDNVRMRFPEDSISYQLKQMNRQLIAIGQFIISIFAGFLFGFRGVEWMVGNLDFGFRLLLGVMCALVIALAEIYFLAKKLNEELSVPETTQLGGPPKFADEKLNENRIRKSIDKPHQD